MKLNEKTRILEISAIVSEKISVNFNTSNITLGMTLNVEDLSREEIDREYDNAVKYLKQKIAENLISPIRR